MPDQGLTLRSSSGLHFHGGLSHQASYALKSCLQPCCERSYLAVTFGLSELPSEVTEGTGHAREGCHPCDAMLVGPAMTPPAPLCPLVSMYLHPSSQIHAGLGPLPVCTDLHRVPDLHGLPHRRRGEVRASWEGAGGRRRLAAGRGDAQGHVKALCVPPLPQVCALVGQVDKLPQDEGASRLCPARRHDGGAPVSATPPFLPLSPAGQHVVVGS